MMMMTMMMTETALAINDLACLLIRIVRFHVVPQYQEHGLLGFATLYPYQSTRNLEPLLVLAFSVERLFAILRPLQVSCPCVTVMLT